MTTKVTVHAAHAVHIEVRGEQETISDILEAGSPPRDYLIWGEKVLTVKEVPNAAAPIATPPIAA